MPFFGLFVGLLTYLLSSFLLLKGRRKRSIRKQALSHFEKSYLDFFQDMLFLFRWAYVHSWFERNSNQASYVIEGGVNGLHTWIPPGVNLTRMIFSHPSDQIDYLYSYGVKVFNREGFENQRRKISQLVQSLLQRKEAFHELPLTVINWNNIYHLNHKRK